jgi:hypothetical protein
MNGEGRVGLSNAGHGKKQGCPREGQAWLACSLTRLVEACSVSAPLAGGPCILCMSVVGMECAILLPHLQLTAVQDWDPMAGHRCFYVAHVLLIHGVPKEVVCQHLCDMLIQAAAFSWR